MTSKASVLSFEMGGLININVSKIILEVVNTTIERNVPFIQN